MTICERAHRRRAWSHHEVRASALLACATLALLLAACGGAPSHPATNKPTATVPQAAATPTPTPLSVYFGAADSSIYALKASDGSVRWTYKTPGDVAVLAVVDGVLYASSRSASDNNLYAISTGDGSLLWKYATGAVYGVESTNGVVYTVSGTNVNDMTAYALDASTGVLLWKKTGSAAGGLSVFGTTAYFTYDTTPPSYGGPSDGFVYAVNARTGAPLWQYESVGEPVEGPSVFDNVVYLPTRHGVYALNAATGAVLWHTKVGYDNYISTISGSVLYVSSVQAGELTALNRADGAVLWTFGSGDYGTRGLDIVGDTFYLATDTGLYALKAANGSEVWHYRDPKEVISLSAGAGVVCVTSGDDKLYAFNAATGAQLWQFQGLPESMVASVSGSTVFAAATQNTNPYAVPPPNNGVIYAFNAITGAQQWKYQADSAIGGGFVVA